MPSKGDRGGYLEQLSDVLIQVLPVTRNGGSGVALGSSAFCEKSAEAARQVSGSRIRLDHARSWVDCCYQCRKHIAQFDRGQF